MEMRNKELKQLLEDLYLRYNHTAFIGPDPISVPHGFTKKQDIEIAGLFAAILAWGQRTTILNNLSKLMELMDQSPYQFIVDHTDKDRRRFLGFVHRTFNDTDLLYFLEFLQFYYRGHASMEDLFYNENLSSELHIGSGIVQFHQQFFSLPHLARTEKHIATPLRKSACKRLNLYLRWMVRKDEHGVDFGIWKKIKPSQLLCPLDVHVHRSALELGLIHRQQADWTTTLLLTDKLRELDPKDPVKYDFALFGYGLQNKW